MWASFDDPDYDNDDSEFANIRLLYFSNQVTQDSTFPDEEVPMIPCQNEYMPNTTKDAWYPGTFYCPDWSEDHSLYATYKHDIKSYFRLEVHRCDPERRAKVGKECASRYDINLWFSKRIYAM